MLKFTRLNDVSCGRLSGSEAFATVAVGVNVEPRCGRNHATRLTISYEKTPPLPTVDARRAQAYPTREIGNSLLM